MEDTNDLLNRLIESHQRDFDLKTPTKHEDKVKSNHPRYTIVAKGIFNDTIKGRKNAGPCYAFKTSIYRLHEDAHGKTHHPLSSGKLIKKDVIVCVPTGSWAASIQAHMAQSIVIKSLKIIRSQIEGKIENVIQETEFTNCKIMTYDQVDDKIIFSFTYEAKTDDFTDYTKDGLKKGHAGITIKSDSEGQQPDKPPLGPAHNIL